MKVKEKGTTVIIKKSSETIVDFADKIVEQYHSFIDKNIIVDIEELTIKPIDLIPFEELAQQHISNKKSFVIVADTDFDEMDDAMIVVPSLQEAHDIIQMEEIERDLGF